MTKEQICILIAICGYLAIVLIIGAVYSRSNKKVDDFYLGGRKLNPLVTAMSAEASDMSSWLLLGLPGAAYLAGIGESAWVALGLAIGTYLNWLIVAKRLRTYSEKLGAITVPQFFSKRYQDKNNILTLISAIIIIVFFVPYTASGFAACGKLFTTLFGVDYHIAMIVSAVVIVGYTTIGGFTAASTTDLIQSIMMTVALIVVLFFGINVAGGWSAVMENAKGLSGYLSLIQSHDAVTGEATSLGFLKIISTLAWGLGYFGMPHILLRFMAIKDRNKIKLSRRIASIWVVISMCIALLIGVIGLAMSKNGSIPTLEGAQSETVIIQIAELLSHNGIFAALVAGLIMAGILACTMSTSDSQLLAASSGISENILHEVFHLNLSERVSMLIARISMIVIAVIAVILAWNPDSSVFKIVSFAWAGFGAAFGPVVLLALFWKRSTKQGAIAGMLTGGAMVFIWKYGIALLGGIFTIYELLPAFLLGLLVNVIVSLCTKKPSEEIIAVFEQSKKEC